MFSANQLVANAPHIDDLHRRVVLQVAADFGDVNVHAAGIEDAVIAPKLFEGRRALEYSVAVHAQVAQQFRLAVRKGNLLAGVDE